jgi:hypothetical protein
MALIKKHLIEPHEVEQYARPCTVDEDIVERAIEEAELLDIKPALGDKLFNRLQNSVTFSRLMEGGEYEACGETRTFAGLKRTLAYYTWARLINSATHHLTRFGYVLKDGEYSRTADLKERQQAVGDATAVANAYMHECLDYIKANPDIFAEYRGCGAISANKTTFRVIGD